MTELTREAVVGYLLQLERSEESDGATVWIANNNLAESEIAGCDLKELYRHLDTLAADGLITYLQDYPNPIDEFGYGIVTREIALSDELLNG